MSRSATRVVAHFPGSKRRRAALRAKSPWGPEKADAHGQSG